MGPAPVHVFVHGGYWRALDKSDFSYVAHAFRPAGVVKAGCGISGLYDLDPIRLCYLNDELRLTPEQVRRNSPVLAVPARSGPLLLAVGALEGPEYHRQTEDLAAAWRARGLRCEVMDMAGHDHFSIAMQLDEPASELSRAILGQMGLR